MLIAVVRVDDVRETHRQGIIEACMYGCLVPRSMLRVAMVLIRNSQVILVVERKETYSLVSSRLPGFR